MPWSDLLSKLFTIALLSILCSPASAQASKMCTKTGTMRLSTPQELLGDLAGLYRERRFDTILDITESLDDPTSTNAEIQNLIGAAFAETGKLDKAAASFTHAIELNSSYAGAYHNLGLTYTKQRKLPDAVKMLREATTINPVLVGGFVDLASALVDLAPHTDKDLGPAVIAVRRAIELQPQLHTAYNLLGVIYRKSNRLEGAAANFKMCVMLSPTFYPGYHNLGIALKGLNKPEAALNSWKSALEVKPDFVEGLVNQGCLSSQLGDFKGAAVAFQNVLNLKPDHQLPTQHVVELLKTAHSLRNAAL